MAALMGVAHAEDKKVTIGVSIPAADHGWTAGVVFHAERMAKLLMAQHPGLKVIVKTSPDPATQANALQDLVTRASTRWSYFRPIPIRWSTPSRK
jgi:ABC-type sugar transport system, periplasmic component